MRVRAAGMDCTIAPQNGMCRRSGRFDSMSVPRVVCWTLVSCACAWRAGVCGRAKRWRSRIPYAWRCQIHGGGGGIEARCGSKLERRRSNMTFAAGLVRRPLLLGFRVMPCVACVAGWGRMLHAYIVMRRWQMRNGEWAGKGSTHGCWWWVWMCGGEGEKALRASVIAWGGWRGVPVCAVQSVCADSMPPGERRVAVVGLGCVRAACSVHIYIDQLCTPEAQTV